MLFVITASYILSSWMIDFAYRATFFFIVAAVGAFHRLMLQNREGVRGHAKPGGELSTDNISLRRGTAALGRKVSQNMPVQMPMAARYGPVAPAPLVTGKEISQTGMSGIGWRKFGIIDFALVWLITREWLVVWGYVLDNV
jgi:hypothetical protein